MREEEQSLALTDAAAVCQVKKDSRRQGKSKDMEAVLGRGLGSGRVKVEFVINSTRTILGSFGVPSVWMQTLSNSSSVASGNFSWRLSFSTLEMKRIPYLTARDREVQNEENPETQKCDHVGEEHTESCPPRR